LGGSQSLIAGEGKEKEISLKTQGRGDWHTDPPPFVNPGRKKKRKDSEFLNEHEKQRGGPPISFRPDKGRKEKFVAIGSGLNHHTPPPSRIGKRGRR